MEEVLRLIDKIIEEHKTIIGRLKTLEQVANDAEAIVGFDKANQVFMPGRLEQKEGLQELQDLLDKIARGLRAHFKREETALLTAFERYGDKNMASSLSSSLFKPMTNASCRPVLPSILSCNHSITGCLRHK